MPKSAHHILTNDIILILMILMIMMILMIPILILILILILFLIPILMRTGQLWAAFDSRSALPSQGESIREVGWRAAA